MRKLLLNLPVHKTYFMKHLSQGLSLSNTESRIHNVLYIAAKPLILLWHFSRKLVLGVGCAPPPPQLPRSQLFIHFNAHKISPEHFNVVMLSVLYTWTGSAGPRLAAVKMDHSPGRAPRVTKYASWSVERIAVAVIVAVEADLQRSAGGIGSADGQVAGVGPELQRATTQHWPHILCYVYERWTGLSRSEGSKWKKTAFTKLFQRHRMSIE